MTVETLRKLNFASPAEAVQKLVDLDGYLGNYRDHLELRYKTFLDWIDKISSDEGSLDSFSLSYKNYGFSVSSKGIQYREYAPGAKEAYLVGDFNGWNRHSHKMKRNEFGLFEIFLPNDKATGALAIPHNTKVKISMVTQDVSAPRTERIPAYIKRATQDMSVSPNYDGIFWNPEVRYTFVNKRPTVPKDPRIYEAHVGICTPEGKVASYNDFREKLLPRVRELGYNTIQLMAIMEHPYYASFGYQVTNFFAPSSRFGTPEELKALVDAAHGMGISVLLDVVHSHACKNVEDGLNMFDGTDYCYFHAGSRGRHDLWDSRLFNYGSYETLRFLLGNIRYWLDEFQFDGFRFDGVTSMLYHHHGMGTGFSGNYDEYFGMQADVDAVVYMMLANTVCKQVCGNTLTIAEDVSGMPTLCRPTAEGGIGFDYRLAMAIPDMWIRVLKHLRDEEWDIGSIVHTLTNRRWKEPSIAYVESHDQALVGDKTVAFWLMDKEMYDYMSELSPLTPIIDRGIALHKMIRLLTSGLGGEGYLTFMGNEFGHPEWLDFPRQGNSNSYHYARRQYNLVDDKLLRYKFLYAFDSAMNKLEQQYHWLSSGSGYVQLKHEDDKVIAFERGNLLWIFNFHPSKSFSDYRIGTDYSGKLNVVLNTDSKSFGGHSRVDDSCKYFTFAEPWHNRKNYIMVYIPSRTALVLGLEK